MSLFDPVAARSSIWAPAADATWPRSATSTRISWRACRPTAEAARAARSRYGSSRCRGGAGPSARQQSTGRISVRWWSTASSVVSWPLLLERCAARARRLAVLQTISQLNRVDRRVLTVLWHLAERWGRVTPNGVVLPLALSHRMLGQLVGARRPTVSTALAELVRSGEVARGECGTWVLTSGPVGAPDPRAVASVVPRRSMLASAQLLSD